LQSSSFQIVQFRGTHDLGLRLDVAGQLARAIDPRASSQLNQLCQTQLAVPSDRLYHTRIVSDVGHFFT